MPTTLANPGDSIASFRFKEAYTSRGINQKLYGLLGSGVVRGGKLQTTGAGFGINIVPDSIEGDSIYSYQDVNDLQFTVRQDGTVVLDLTALAGQTVYICLYVGYVIGATTVVNWRAYTHAELFTAPVAEAAFVVILGRVVVPGVGPIPAANITPTARRMAWDDKAPEGWHQCVKNGTFEQAVAAGGAGFFGIEHWFGTSLGTPNFNISTTAPYEGTREFQLNHPAPLAVSSRLLQQTTRVRVEPGQYVRGRVRLRGLLWPGVTVGGNQGMAFTFYTNDHAVISTLWVENTALTGTFAYTLVDGVVEVPATAAWMRVSVGINNLGVVLAAGDLFFDDAKCWVESDHPLEDIFDTHKLSESVAGQEVAITPGGLDTPASMDDWLKRTLLMTKAAQLPGPPIIDQLLAQLRGGGLWRLLLWRGTMDLTSFLAADALVPRLITRWATGGGAYALLWEVPNPTAATASTRFYLSSAGRLVIVVNASYDGANWNKDDPAANTFRLVLASGETLVETFTGASPFADGAWVSSFTFGLTGAGPSAYLQMTGAHLTNPGAQGRFTRDALVTMWSSMVTDGAGGLSFSYEYNVASYAFVGSKIQLTLHQNIVNGSYTGSVSAVGGTTPHFMSIYTISATVIEVAVYDTAGALIDLSTNIFRLHVSGSGGQA